MATGPSYLFMVLLVMITGASFRSFSQTTIALYPDSIPNSKPSVDEEKAEIKKLR